MRALLIILLSLSFSLSSRSAAFDSPTTTAIRPITLYQGPGITHLTSGTLAAGIEAQIIERNAAGTWLRLQRQNSAGTVITDGWTMTGYLALDTGVRFSEIPVNDDLADANPATVNSRSLAALYQAPVIPTISDAMLEVFIAGQAHGNDARTITKIGDSLSASRIYLVPMSQPDAVLGAHDDLEDTILYYGASAALPSVASRIGMSTLVVFDPMWATDARCEAGESPLACEYRVKQPAVALILFGPNDVLSMTTEIYTEQMRKIIETSLEAGVIPVLSTFSVHPDYAYWWQSINFNLALVDLAAEYEIPLMNLWAAARPLPEYGLDEDGIHLAHSGFEALRLDRGHETWYGVSLQNLLAIRTLDAIRRKLDLSLPDDNLPETTQDNTQG